VPEEVLADYPGLKAAEAVEPPVRMVKEPGRPGGAVEIDFDRIGNSKDIEAALGALEKELGAGHGSKGAGHQASPCGTEILGLKAKEKSRLGGGRLMTPAREAAAGELLTESAEKLKDLAKKTLAGEQPRAAYSLMRQFVLHDAIRAHLLGKSEEASRILAPFKAISENQGMGLRMLTELLAGEETRRLAEMIASLDSPAEATIFVRKARQSNDLDQLNEAWVTAATLRSPAQGVDILADSLDTLWRVPEGQAIPGPGNRVGPGETAAQAFGLIQGIKDGLVLFGKAHKANLLSRQAGLADPPRKRSAGGEGPDSGGPAGRAADLLDLPVRLPSRLEGAEKDLFRAMGHRMGLYAEGFRRAWGEGLKGREAAEKIQEMVTDPPPNLRVKDIDGAKFRSFVNELEKLQERPEEAPEIPGLRLIAPFLRAPFNLQGFIAEKSHLAPLTASLQEEVRAGDSRRDLALARTSLGSLIAAAAATLTAEGRLTGSGPNHPEARRAWAAGGWRPNSVKIGAGYLPYSRTSPWGKLLGLTADATEVIGQLEGGRAEELALALVSGIGRLATRISFLSQAGRFLAALRDGTRRPGINPLGELGGKASHPPDPAFRSAVATLDRISSLLEKWKADLPGYGPGLPPPRDPFGRPRVILPGERRESGLTFDPSKQYPDPVDRELARLGVSLSMPPKQIEGLELNPREYDRLVFLAGNGAKLPQTGLGFRDSLAQMIQGRGELGPVFQDQSGGSDQSREALIKSLRNDFTALAVRQVQKDLPELGRLLRQRREAGESAGRKTR